MIFASGGGYGEISPTAYDDAKAVYSISNRRAAERIESASAQIALELRKGGLSEKEAAWLTDILDTAKAGDWSAATHAARRLMEDQAR